MKQTVYPLILLVALLCTGCVKNLDYYVIGVSVNPAGSATVTGGGMYEKGATATLAVTPADGYTFIAWSDGNTDNPRSVTVTADADYTAQCIVTPNGGGNQEENYDNIVIWGLKNNGSYDTAWVPYTDLGTEDRYLGLRLYNSFGMLSGHMFSSSNDTYPPTHADAVYLEGSWSRTGEYTYQSDNDGLMDDAILEYWSSYDSLLVDTHFYYGNWWGKEMTLTVSAIDLTASTVSLEISAIMYDAYRCFLDHVAMSACPTKQLYIKLTNARIYSAN